MPSKTYYTKDHEWIKITGNTAYVGITNFAQSELGDIIFVEMPDENTEFSKGDVFGTIEAVKTVADLYMPIKSTILEINNKIEDKPELINDYAENEGWLIKVNILNIDDFDDLLSLDEYNKIIS